MSADDKELSESLRQTFKKGDLIVCRGVIRTVIKRYYIGNGHFVLDVEDANGGIEPVSESTCEAYVHQPESVTNAPDLAAAELEKITKLLDDCGFIGGVSVLARVRELMRRHATNNAEVWKGLAERLTVEALIQVEVRK